MTDESIQGQAERIEGYRDLLQLMKDGKVFILNCPYEMQATALQREFESLQLSLKTLEASHAREKERQAKRLIVLN